MFLPLVGLNLKFFRQLIKASSSGLSVKCNFGVFVQFVKLLIMLMTSNNLKVYKVQ